MYLQLPPELRYKKSLINVQTETHSFLLSILAAFSLPKHHRTRATYYRKLLSSNEKFKQIAADFPSDMTIQELPRFEALTKIRINVFVYTQKAAPTFLQPVYVSRNKYKTTVNLLYLRDGSHSHYVLIRKLNAALRLKTKHRESKHFCPNCFASYSEERLLVRHQLVCSSDDVVEEIAEEGSVMEFSDYRALDRYPLVCYADFESFLKPTSSEEYHTEHVPCGYSYVIKSPFENVSNHTVVYRGENPVNHFLANLFQEYKNVTPELNHVEEMVFTSEDKEKYESSTKCHICSEDLDWSKDSDDLVVRDHNHVTGIFR